jgi:hypothetical protein
VHISVALLHQTRHGRGAGQHLAIAHGDLAVDVPGRRARLEEAGLGGGLTLVRGDIGQGFQRQAHPHRRVTGHQEQMPAPELPGRAAPPVLTVVPLDR